MKYEIKKFFSKRLNQIIIAIMILLAIILSFLAIGSIHYVDEYGDSHTGIAAGRKLAEDRNRWQGELSTERINEIVKDYQALSQKYNNDIPNAEYGKSVQSYEDIKYFVIDVLYPNSNYDPGILDRLTDEDIQNLYSTYFDNCQKEIKTYSKTPEQEAFLSTKYEELESPIYYEAKDSWDTIVMYAQTYGMVLAVVIGFLASGIFADEFRTKAESVFFATRYGRSRAVRNKLLTGILITTIIYWAGMGILSLLSFGIMGTSGFATPYRIYQPYSMYNITYGEYYILILVCGYIASLFSSAITMSVTVKMHSSNLANCIPFFLYCMMPFIGRALQKFSAVFDLMPSVFMNIIEYVKVCNIYQIGPIVVQQIPLVMIIYSILSIVLLPFVYKSFSKYGLA